MMANSGKSGVSKRRGTILPIPEHAQQTVSVRSASVRQYRAMAEKRAIWRVTTVFAFHCVEGVIIGGDHRATAGHTIFSDKTEKILELDSHSLMAIAGVPAMAFEMARTLQTAFEFYRRSQLQAMSLPAKIRALSRLLRENLPATLQGVGAVSPVFVGVETAEPAVRPVIYSRGLGERGRTAVEPGVAFRRRGIRKLPARVELITNLFFAFWTGPHKSVRFRL
jgi:hypothetical protein